MSTTSLFIGVTAALAGAFFQASSYFFLRNHNQKEGLSPIQIIVQSHVIKSVFALILLVFLGLNDLPPLKTYLWPLAQAIAAYAVAQCWMIYCMRDTEASRLAPILSVKVFSTAIILNVLYQTSFTTLQWLGVGLCVCALLVLNYSGGSLPKKIIFSTMGVCILYSFSDIGIQESVRAMSPASSTGKASLYVLAFSYLACGILALPVLPFKASRRPEDWKDSFLYAALWFVAIGGFIAGIGFLNAVFGTIVQSTRGIFGILIGWIVARKGHHHIETPLERSVFIRRIVAGIGMTLAIALFCLSE